MTEKNKVQHLKNSHLFSSLSEKEIDQISEAMILKQFKKNEIILYEDDVNGYIFFILNGRVKAVQTSFDGKESILSIHKSGDVFGEISLIDKKTVPAMFTAVEETSLAVISNDAFCNLMRDQSKLVEILLQVLCSRLRESWERIQLLNFNNASQRMKTLLLMLSEEYGRKTTEGVTLNINLTHQDMADMTGMTRETVTRALDKLRKDGEINVYEKKSIHLSSIFFEDEATSPFTPITSRCH